MYNTILFDLDGTLTESGRGIINSAVYALKKFGREIPDASVMGRFIGPPLHSSFENLFGFSKTDTEAAVACYREYYVQKGMFENALYDGIAQLLQKLHEENYKLIVATSKMEAYVVQILEHYKIKQYFSYVAGSKPDGTRAEKHEVIAYALEAARVSDKSSAVMIGDREYDILGAGRVGLASAGVLYGYGSREELEAAGASYIAEKVTDIYPIVSGKRSEQK